MRKSTYIITTLIFLSFAINFLFYPLLPQDFASHWNAAGHVNGYMPKFWGAFLTPIITIVMLALFLILPKIDPLKKNVDKFRDYYEGFMVMMTAFMLYLHLLTIFWNLGYKFNMIIYLTPAFTILFYYIGIMLAHAKRNWFIGIKTPWTLSSDEIWNKTHRLGSKMFKVTGIIALLSIIWPNYAIIFIIIPAIATAAATMIYSYVEYKKVNRHHQRQKR